MVMIPVDTPVAMPVKESIVADVLNDGTDHTPPAVGSVNSAVCPMQTLPGPTIADGSGNTVTTSEALQPVGSV